MRSITGCVATLSLLSLLAACSNDPNRPRPDGIISGDGPRVDGGPAKKLTWVKNLVDPERAGKQSAIGSFGAKLGVAYFRELPNDVIVQCPASGAGGPAGPKARPAQDLMYAAFDGTNWGAPVKIDQTIGVAYGISLTMNKSSGKVYVGYLGGAMSMNECASSDAVIASSTNGSTFTKRTVAGDGITAGDTVGYWMSVALDSKGVDHAAFGDVRFGYYEADGKGKASARYDASDAIAADNGAGVYNSLVFDPTDRPIVAFFNPMQKGTTGGIQLGVKTNGTWEVKAIVGGATSERLSLGTSGKLFAVAYYDPSDQALRFVESADLKVWKDEMVDTDKTHNGEFASLAYDSKGNPGISYYKCGKYQSAVCDPARDGLKFAHRDSSNVWTTYDVDTGDVQACGTYTSLAFATDDRPTISYQCIALKNQTNEFLGTLKVAQGVYQ